MTRKTASLKLHIGLYGRAYALPCEVQAASNRRSEVLTTLAAYPVGSRLDIQAQEFALWNFPPDSCPTCKHRNQEFCNKYNRSIWIAIRHMSMCDLTGRMQAHGK